jgi:restriction system protein
VSDSVPAGGQAAAWLVRGGEAGEREQRGLVEGLTFIGWAGLGDISGYTRDGIRLALKAAYPEYADNVIANWTGQLWRFTNQITIGDYVVMPLHTRLAARRRA